MSSYTDSIFSSLKWNSVNTGMDYLEALVGSVHYQENHKGQLKYLSPTPGKNMYVARYESMLAHVVYEELGSLYSKYKTNSENIREKAAVAAKQKQMKVIIKNQNFPSGLSSGVTDEDGNLTPEALKIWRKLDTPRTFSYTSYDSLTKQTTELTKTSSNLTFIDYSAIIDFGNDKNIVLSKVTGRKYSRKEIVSGGDEVFSCNGKIVSDYADVYPFDEVAKFIELMDYNGVLNIQTLACGVHNITQILIQSYKMGQTMGFKNEQPYSFSFIAIQPDREVTANSDTISIVNDSISSNASTGWLNSSLAARVNKKVNEQVNKTVDSTLTKASDTVEEIIGNII